jgi:hypothetical protein
MGFPRKFNVIYRIKDFGKHQFTSEILACNVAEVRQKFNDIKIPDVWIINIVPL